MYIYRITRRREYPRFYQSRTQILYGTGKRAAAIARSVRNQTDDLASRGYPPVQRVFIERAPVGEFEDVTAEFTGHDDE